MLGDGKDPGLAAGTHYLTHLLMAGTVLSALPTLTESLHSPNGRFVIKI